jgi:hypothetical protein
MREATLINCNHRLSKKTARSPLAKDQGRNCHVHGFSHIFNIDKSSEMSYPCMMKQLIAAKLKLHTDPQQFQALRTTQLAYRDALPPCQPLLV